MKGYFEGWRRYLHENNGPEKIDVAVLAKASEKNIISGREAAQQGVTVAQCAAPCAAAWSPRGRQWPRTARRWSPTARQ